MGKANPLSWPAQKRPVGPSAKPDDGGRLVGAQIIITLAGALVAYLVGGMAQAGAALFGGMVAVTIGLVTLQRLKRMEDAMRGAPGQVLAGVYGIAFMRIILALVLFGLGIRLLRLEILPAIAVFAAAQLAPGFGFRNRV
jgi:pheromone shutdown protein TraB